MVEFGSGFLVRLRREALRKRVWFSVLDSTERALLTLVPLCVDVPRNAVLIDILAKVVVKVKDALKSRIAVLTGQVGRPLAVRLSCMAQKWGHRTAGEWARDERFWKYLAVVTLNMPCPFSGRSVEGGKFG